ncbi:hypothetical protein BXE05_13770 [Salmonella enterica subsp. enterica]|nr:hypothetical protein [Salmonella enterica subsp. enterica serovar Newport]EBW5250538.1 hypothetical protein [Salmonella enterica subsp. enterica serovar Newport]MIV34768.1 hypothetical protein [Salmonella enterica subsp. enterica serovar Newport]HCO3755912.1 hypothetical protein [Escherichia coli]HCO3884091.1 hypothetical protein [Escherichia coli]
MAIHAKASGLLIGGKIVDESDKFWIFQARDNKKPNAVSKTDAKNKVFPDDANIDDVIAWQEQAHKALREAKS